MRCPPAPSLEPRPCPAQGATIAGCIDPVPGPAGRRHGCVAPHRNEAGRNPGGAQAPWASEAGLALFIAIEEGPERG